MMDIIVSKDKNISRWVDQENLINVHDIESKTGQRQRRLSIEEKEVSQRVK